MDRDLIKLKSLLFDFGMLFNQQPSSEKIDIYAKFLEKYSDEQIIYAFSKITESGTPYFPSLGELLQHILPPKESKPDLAAKVAVEILSLIREFSQYDEKKMLEKASNEAKLVLKLYGSTMDLRLSENIETCRAQLERYARSVLQAEEIKVKREELAKIGIKSEENISDIRRVEYGQLY